MFTPFQPVIYPAHNMLKFQDLSGLKYMYPVYLVRTSKLSTISDKLIFIELTPDEITYDSVKLDGVIFWIMCNNLYFCC